MNRPQRRFLGFAACAALVLGGCGDDKPTVTTDITATTSATTTATAMPETTTPAKHLVRVEFDGGMTHIMKRSNNKPSRTAFLRNAHVAHSVKVILPMDPAIANDAAMVKIQKEKIEKALGQPATVIAGKAFAVKDVSAVTFRIIDPSSKQAMKPALTTSTDFEFFVPHLSTVAKVPEADLDPAIDGNPGSSNDANTKFVAFYELDGGVLSASPFCMRARFEPDEENRGMRSFVQRVVLTGETSRPAVLEVTKVGAQPVELSFGDVDLVRIVFENQPSNGNTGNPHFDMHQHVKGGTPGTWPVIKDMQAFCAVSDTVPGCANTAWP